MKILLIFFILVFAVSSCNKSDSSNHEKKSAETSDNEIKKREVDLREKELALKERELELQKTDDNKDENEIKCDFPEASARVLTDEDLRNKIPWGLRVMRNEIFARLGYKFKSEDMRDYFLKKSWYIPLYDNVEGLLSNIETENIELIKRYEKYLGSSYNESYAR